jgi:serine/threonine protein kinase
MSQAPLSTILRHPLASKRCMMIFNANGEETMEIFELLSRYEAVSPIGQGTYGFVCSARDNDLVEAFQVNPPEEYEEPSLSPEDREEIYDTATLVAVKKLRQLFEHNQPRMWLCATREIQLMMAFQHDNVISATDFFIPLGGVEMMTYESILNLQCSFDSVYVVMKKMDYTLREVLDSTEVTEEELDPDYAALWKRLNSLMKTTNEEHHNATAAAAEAGTNSDVAEKVGETQTQTYTTTVACASVDGSAGDAVVLTKTTAEDELHVETPAPQENNGASPLSGIYCPITGLHIHALTKDYRKFILYQIFRGVGYLHLCPVIHRDLKPENIMLDRSYGTRITDFGQGRDVGVNTASDYEQTMLDNCTQWYAAPETLTVAINSPVGFIDHESFHGVDVWSIGCIAAEMLIGRPLFYTAAMGGKAQLLSIFRVLGEPSQKAIESIADYRDKDTKEFFINSIKKLIKTAPPSTTLQFTLDDLLRSPFGDEDEDERRLIMDCLCWDPRDRITIQAALQNPYFTKDKYDPTIDPDDTAKRVPSVRPEDISEPVSGRAFLWNLFLERHPEVGELWKSLVAKHDKEVKAAAAAAAAAAGGSS